LFGVAGEVVAIFESLWFDLGELNCNKEVYKENMMLVIRNQKYNFGISRIVNDLGREY